MPATSAYDMICPIARALDVLGERWTLLILRELSIGEQRFTDLRRSISGIPPNVLSARLKALRAEGLVETRELPPPAARTVYLLTGRGREALPVLRSLARWGLDLLEAPDPSTVVRPVSVIAAWFVPFYDRRAAAGVDERYQLVIDGEPFWLSSVPGARATGDDGPADLVLEGPAWAFMAARQGTRPLDDLIDDGTVIRSGPVRSLRNFERVFALAGLAAGAGAR